MDKFIISSDSTCDLSEKLIKENDIRLLPLTITLGEEQFKDGVNITTPEVLDYVDRTGVLPKTSANSVYDYEEFFKQLTAEGYGVLHFNISSEDSACYNNACLAAKSFDNVYVVDSRQLSTGQGLLVMKACDYKKEGATLKECYEKIEAIKNNARTSFVVDRLDFLHKGGRCSLLSLLGAKILKIHPHITMIDGSLKVKRKCSGSMVRSCEQYVQDLAQEYTSYDKTRVFITHCMASDAILSAVRAKVEELFDFDEIIETNAGTTISSHCGKNTIGVLFIEE